MQVVDWKIIIKEHGPVVWQTAYRLLGNNADAADCFQDTFVCALEICRRQHIRNFSALLIRLATTRAIDRLRKRLRHERCETSGFEKTQRSSPDPARNVEQQELAARLKTALTQLPFQEAQVFCLRYLNDMTYRNIANELGITISAVGVILHRAKTKLKRLCEISGKGQKSEVIL